MNNTKRVLAALALAGAALTITGTAHASGILGLGDTGSSNNDSSLNQNLGIFGDSIMDGTHNTFGPSALIKGVDGIGTSHVR
ncbi:hypothetical protein [Kitasatospora sp. NPDC091276]|uniref:hypothetical protein n=1 Tax=unclassified Kitasatospora TaxID=2633591 RepID=UPI00342416FD